MNSEYYAIQDKFSCVISFILEYPFHSKSFISAQKFVISPIFLKLCTTGVKIGFYNMQGL